ncbi:YbjQ family protein [Patulibacter sp. S7RM1-6]
MQIVTTNDIPGHVVEEVLGEVFGLTVRSRNVGSNIGAGFKSLVGGELKGITKMLQDSRKEALERLAQEAEAVGGNAVLAFRFETTEYASTGTEVCAYGTAVRVRPA